MSAQILLFDLMADLPNRIRELRLARGLSQDKVADAIRCSKMQISELERGQKPLTLGWMRRLAAVFEVTPGELLNPEDNPLILSDDERELLEDYRVGSDDQKAGIASVAKALTRTAHHKDEAA